MEENYIWWYNIFEAIYCDRLSMLEKEMSL